MRNNTQRIPIPKRPQALVARPALKLVPAAPAAAPADRRVPALVALIVVALGLVVMAGRSLVTQAPAPVNTGRHSNPAAIAAARAAALERAPSASDETSDTQEDAPEAALAGVALQQVDSPMDDPAAQPATGADAADAAPAPRARSASSVEDFEKAMQEENASLANAAKSSEDPGGESRLLGRSSL